MFLHLFVILSTAGVCLSACWDTKPLWEAHPLPRNTHPPEAHPLEAHPPEAHTPPPREAYTPLGDGCRCGRYASYWNAFLFKNAFRFEVKYVGLMNPFQAFGYMVVRVATVMVNNSLSGIVSAFDTFNYSIGLSLFTYTNIWNYVSSKKSNIFI